MLCTPVSPSVPRTYTGVGVGWGGGILFRENNIPLMKFIYLVFSHVRRELEQVTEIFVAMFDRTGYSDLCCYVCVTSFERLLTPVFAGFSHHRITARKPVMTHTYTYYTKV